MVLDRLIRELARPGAFSEPPGDVEVLQTHASVVFRGRSDVYKIKKPVDLGFLDYGSLAKRQHFCQREVELNRRLAADVYLGVVPVVEGPDGLQFGGEGEPVEWAVHMVRLPDRARMVAVLERGEVTKQDVTRLAQRLAEFHRHAHRDAQTAAGGGFDVVESNCLDNFAALAKMVDVGMDTGLLEHLEVATRAELQAQQPAIEERARRRLPCDTHGDLRLDHVYLFREREPPDDLRIIDCIEFSESLRYTDPVTDVAFLVMDLRAHGAWAFADAMVDGYLAHSDEASGRSLFPLYVAYRAAVRAKVGAIKAQEPEVDARDREEAVRSVDKHLRLAIDALAPALTRPCLLLVGGLPGTGKSSLARALADDGGFSVIRSDVVRKELAGVASESVGTRDIYTAQWSDRTYAECLRRAEGRLRRGERVIVDANFKEASRRRRFLAVGRDLGIFTRFVQCEASPQAVRQRLRARTGDASDADWTVHQMARQAWEEPSSREIDDVWHVDTQRPIAEAVAMVRERLVAAGRPNPLPARQI